MTAHAHIVQNSVVPLLRYRDLARAMDWLHEVFGFEKQLAVSDPDGEVVYGQMRYGSSLIMLGTVRDTDLDGFMTQPDEVGGFETQTCYVVIENAEEHFSRSVMAGADILLELKSDPHGRRGYACRDPEGHIWNFGTFHPTVGALTTLSAATPDDETEVRSAWHARVLMAASLLLALFAGFAARDYVRETSAVASIAAQEGTTDYAYQLLALVRGEARALAQERDKLKQDLETLVSEKTQRETAAKTAEATVEAEKAQRSALEAQLADAREALKARELAEAQALKQARDAEARLEAGERERLAAAATSHAPSQAERDAQERSAAVMQEGSRAIETSATTGQEGATSASESSSTSGSEESPAPEADTQASSPPAPATSSKSASAKRTSLLSAHKSSVQEVQPHYQPTYLLELSDVPWPYTTWHQREIKHR